MKEEMNDVTTAEASPAAAAEQPGFQDNQSSINEHTDTGTAGDAQAETIASGPAIGQAMPRQPEQPQQPEQYIQQLPPGYAVDPRTGQVVFVGQMYQQPGQPVYPQPGVVYVQQQPTPEQIAAEQAAAQQRYGKIVNSVERFIEGEATVSDVVKTLYTATSQDDQLWKGVVVGAAAAVLLTSGPIRDAMGKTLGGLFPGLKEGKASGGSAAPAENVSDTASPRAASSTTTDKG